MRFVPSNGKLVWTAIATSVIGAAISSGAALKVVQFSVQPITRPDPYTGSQAKELESRVALLEQRISRLEKGSK